jgi:hypothetical protein
VWSLRLIWGIGALFIASLMGFLLWCWRASAEEALAPRAERHEAWQRSIQWVQVHEQQLLEDPNPALWWMLRHAAQAGQHAYLQQLVERYVARHYPLQAGEQSPWRSLVMGRGTQPVLAVPVTHVLAMDPYQRDFLQASTCEPVPKLDGHVPGAFLTQHLCQPNLLHALRKDKVCATHQLMTMYADLQSNCPSQGGQAEVRKALLADVKSQLYWLPGFEDAYIQRVLSIHWLEGTRAVRPIWFNRVLRAQRSDGGWAGERWLVELPVAMQPSTLRNMLLRLRGLPERPVMSDFHATAQAMLLVALSLNQGNGAVWSSPDE